MAATGDNIRLALLDEIEGLERLLESDASWVAWRAIDRLLARGTGPAPSEAGAEIGRCIERLCTSAPYIAWLAAHERLRALPAASSEVPRTKGRRRTRTGAAPDTVAANVPPPVGEAPPGFSAAAVGPPPPFTPMHPVGAPAEAEPPKAAPPPMLQSSLLERIARLEKETVGLKPLAEAVAAPSAPPPARPVPLVVEEAELTIDVPDEGAEAGEAAPARGLLARLERIADSLASKPSAARSSPQPAEEAEIEIVTDEGDDAADSRPSDRPRARSSHER